MKAKKSLIITLFAAVMTFALGATMVFAASSAFTFNDDYTKVTIKGTPYDTTRTYSDGVVTAVVDAGDISATLVEGVAKDAGYDPAKSDGLAPAAWLEANVKASYYDLDNAVVDVPATFAQVDFEKFWNAKTQKWTGVNLKFSAPSYVDNYDAVKKSKTTVAMNDEMADWNFKLSGAEDYVSGSFTDQPLTLTTAPSSKTSTPAIGIFGKVADKAITVKAIKATADKAQFFVDSEKETNKIGTTAYEIEYDGAEHSVVMGAMPGFSVAYTVYNYSNGKFEAASAVTLKDVTEVGKDVVVKATVTNDSDKTDTATIQLTLKVVPAKGTVSVGFDLDGNGGTRIFNVAGTEYDPYAFIVARADVETEKATVAAVEANQADLVAWFKDGYDIEASASAVNPNEVTLKIKPKEMNDAEKKAYEKKYEALIGSFKVVDADKASGTVNLNSTNLVPEIEFVDSPTAVKFKAKKLKKKAASFTVTAVASNNAAVSYKLINAPAKIKIDKTSGQITLAKKLKKGTYKIKVKAYLPTAYKMYTTSGDRSYTEVYVSETHDIKIKVKK